MATMITSECINCGACEPECPNTAIYQGGVEWELNGQMHPALQNDIFYIVPEKCTECVGFYDHEACAAVCPVDCCVPNPDIPETDEVLIARARQLHPDTEFPTDYPSRFKAGNGHAPSEAAPAPAPSAPAPAPAPAAAPAAAPAPAAAKPAAAPAGARIEKPLFAPKTAAPKPKPRVEKRFSEELPISFEEAAVRARQGSRPGNGALRWIVAFAQPILGALPYAQKEAIERAIGDRRFFTAAGATGLNAMHNMILYPVLFAAAGAIFFDRQMFSDQLNTLIFYGLTLASLETIWRMREGFQGRPVEQIAYRWAIYGPLLAPLGAALVRMLGSADQQGSVGQDGFRSQMFDEKLERERRYGEVYRLHEEPNGYFLELEFPRRVPPSAIKSELGLSDEMPDYDYELSLQNGFFVVHGKLTDPNIRRVAAVSPAFPPDFTTQIKLPERVKGFRHRLRDKNLEVVLLKS